MSSIRRTAAPGTRSPKISSHSRAVRAASAACSSGTSFGGMGGAVAHRRAARIARQLGAPDQLAQGCEKMVGMHREVERPVLLDGCRSARRFRNRGATSRPSRSAQTKCSAWIVKALRNSDRLRYCPWPVHRAVPNCQRSQPLHSARTGGRRRDLARSPRATARARPLRVRALVRSRSNSTRPRRTVSINRRAMSWSWPMCRQVHQPRPLHAGLRAGR
jgi:hypothetical protein